LIPKEYIQKYDADNLFIADLPDYWRMIYTIESDEIEIIAFVLDIINHKEYDKKLSIEKNNLFLKFIIGWLEIADCQ